MDNCIIQLEVDHCAKSGCGGPSITNVGVFKNKTHAKKFMRNDKSFRKIFKAPNIKKSILPIAIWAVPGDK
jgi:hypothetical protein